MKTANEVIDWLRESHGLYVDLSEPGNVIGAEVGSRYLAAQLGYLSGNPREYRGGGVHLEARNNGTIWHAAVVLDHHAGDWSVAKPATPGQVVIRRPSTNGFVEAITQPRSLAVLLLLWANEWLAGSD